MRIGDRIAFYRAPLRRRMPDTAFDIRGAGRVAAGGYHLRLCRLGRDGGAGVPGGGGRGGSSRPGFAPGFPGTADGALLTEAVRQGVTVVQSTRAGSGRTFRGTRARESGFLIADNLNPAKGPAAAGAGADRGPRTRRRSRRCSRRIEQLQRRLPRVPVRVALIRVRHLQHPRLGRTAGPAICSPIGQTFGSNPHGTLIAGRPR